jgi:hypothetical protein
MKEIIEFIKELDPKNEVSKFKPMKMTDNDYYKVANVIKTWVKDGILVPQDFVNYMEFVTR